ncbi:MAG: hypothetical protein ABSG59_23235 [Verrucomicrobiota bacterium]|jgi:hypothetical protein
MPGGDNPSDTFVPQHARHGFTTTPIDRMQIGTADCRQGYFNKALTAAGMEIQASFDEFKRLSSAVKHGELRSDHAL